MPITITVYDADVSRVVDGDTLHVIPRFTHKLRLVGVNTPERGQPGYVTANNLVKEWIGTGGIRIAYSGVDDFGRLLSNVWRLSDGACLNDYLKEKGYGYTYVPKQSL